MTSPSDPPADEPGERVDLHKDASGQTEAPADSAVSDEPFDPYRFGRPEHPVPPEFAPPGYVPDPVPAGTAGPWGPPAPPGVYPYPSQTSGPPPGQPYAPYPPQYQPNAAYGSPYGPPSQPGGGKAVTALVLGIGSIVMFWTSILDAVLVVTGIVFGIIALNEQRERRAPGSRRGMAIAGLVCAAVGAVLAIIWTVVIVHVSNACGGADQHNSSQFQQCVRNELL